MSSGTETPRTDGGEVVIDDEDIENPVEVICPHCGTEGLVPEWFLGQKMECKTCEGRFTVEPQEGDASE